MSYRPVLNYPLPDELYNIRHRSVPMANQRSSGSTDSNYSNISAASYQSHISSLHHGNSRHLASTHGTIQHVSYNNSGSQTSNSHYQAPTSPSDKSDGGKEPQYCTHRDCLDQDGRPFKLFSRKADVVRHYKSVHDKQFIDCPWPKCGRKGTNGFTRADHLTEHQRGYHLEDVPKRQNSMDARSRHGHQ